MPSLKDKLNLYKKNKTGAGDSRRPSPEIFGAEKIIEGGSTLWRFTSVYDLKEPAERLGILSTTDISSFARHNGVDPGISFNDLLFVDLETTSLSTAAGSYAFLFGTGLARGTDLVIEQYFMEDYAGEAAILEKLAPLFRDYTAVTYNGKSFDIPLLKTRYRMNRVPGFPVDKKTIDLIHPSRAIFRSIYENCALGTIEEKVLGLSREKDIPSWLIPEVYFSYQKHGETARMDLVVAHHRQDIASMALLILFLNRLFEQVDSRSFDLLHRQSIVNIAQRLCRKEPELFVDMARFLGDDIFRERRLFKRFSSAMKRLGRRSEILSFWEKDGSVYSLEELAKHCEHVEKDYMKALAHCDAAIALLGMGLFAKDGERQGDDIIAPNKKRFEARMSRLRGKIAGGPR